MSATIIPFDRKRRDHAARPTPALAPADVFWLAAVCFPPFCLAVFIGQAVLDGVLAGSRR